jgi:hypothetical protein
MLVPPSLGATALNEIATRNFMRRVHLETVVNPAVDEHGVDAVLINRTVQLPALELPDFSPRAQRQLAEYKTAMRAYRAAGGR